jgi:hypothetical protein
MAYDKARKRIVLFGGGNINGRLGDTWEWNGTDWVQIQATGPAARYLHGMAFAENSGVVVLHGGFAGAGDNNAVWEWDGVVWKPRLNATYANRRGVSLTYNIENRTVVAFGGSLSGTVQNQTWLYTSPVTVLVDLKLRLVKGLSLEVNPGENLKLKLKVKNKKPVEAQYCTVQTYLSLDKNLDANDQLITITVTPRVPGKSAVKVVAEGQIPSTIGPGDYYLISRIEEQDANLSNNTKASKVPITIY